MGLAMQTNKSCLVVDICGKTAYDYDISDWPLPLSIVISSLTTDIHNHMTFVNLHDKTDSSWYMVYIL